MNGLIAALGLGAGALYLMARGSKKKGERYIAWTIGLAGAAALAPTPAAVQETALALGYPASKLAPAGSVTSSNGVNYVTLVFTEPQAGPAIGKTATIQGIYMKVVSANPAPIGSATA